MNFLVIHTRYTDLEIGIFNNNLLIDLSNEASKTVSKNFLLVIDSMLKKQNLMLEDLAFIAAHQGPAPFTTLRVALSFINGLAFSSNINLIGVNGLKILLHEFQSSNKVTVTLLNAFGQDLYYGVHDPKYNSYDLGVLHYTKLFEDLAIKYQDQIQFIGNGVKLYLPEIQKTFGSRAEIIEPVLEIASIENIAAEALQKWNNKHDIVKELMPIYLKSAY